MKSINRFVIAKVVPLIFIVVALIGQQHEFRIQLLGIFLSLFAIETLIFYILGEIFGGEK
jgi:hypothetical protein